MGEDRERVRRGEWMGEDIGSKLEGEGGWERIEGAG